MAENAVIEVGRCIYAKSHIIGARTASLAAATIGVANAVCAAIRNIGPQELSVDSIEQGFITTTSATAFTGIGFAVYKVTGFTVLPATGGRTTAPDPPLPIRKRTLDHFELRPAVLAATVVNIPDTFASVQIATTAALTGGTFTAPEFADPIANFIPPVSLSATNATFAGVQKWEPKNNIPISLAPNEGLIFVNQVAWPTALTGIYSIGVDVRIA